MAGTEATCVGLVAWSPPLIAEAHVFGGRPIRFIRHLSRLEGLIVGLPPFAERQHFSSWFAQSQTAEPNLHVLKQANLYSDDLQEDDISRQVPTNMNM